MLWLTQAPLGLTVQTSFGSCTLRQSAHERGVRHSPSWVHVHEARVVDGSDWSVLLLLFVLLLLLSLLVLVIGVGGEGVAIINLQLCGANRSNSEMNACDATVRMRSRQYGKSERCRRSGLAI